MTYALKQADITWPIGYGTLTCNGQYSCQGVNFPDKPAPTNALYLSFDKIYEAQGSEIYCPESASCTIDCVQSNSCSNVCNSLVINLNI